MLNSTVVVFMIYNIKQKKWKLNLRNFMFDKELTKKKNCMFNILTSKISLTD